MNRDLAKHVATAAVRTSTQLSSLLPLLKTQCDSAEYARLLRSVASVCGHITREILHPIFAEHPDLEKELEASVDTYGKVL
jgi:hypothetical protein